MDYKIELSDEALEDFDSLDNSIKERITNFFDRLKRIENPKMLGKALVGNLAGCWRYQIGKYRIGAKIDNGRFVILVIAIDHRKEFYKKLDKRFKK